MESQTKLYVLVRELVREKKSLKLCSAIKRRFALTLTLTAFKQEEKSCIAVLDQS